MPTNIKITEHVVQELPSERPLVTGEKYKVMQADGTLIEYVINSQGEPVRLKGITNDESSRLDRLSSDQISKVESITTEDITKLKEDYTREQIDTKISDLGNLASSSKVSLGNSTVLPVPPQSEGVTIPNAWVELAQNVTYTQAGGSPITGINGHRSIAEWDNDNEVWSLVDMGELPVADSKIQEWEERVYEGGEQVLYNGIVYAANQNTLPTSIPGISSLWRELLNYTHRELTYGLVVAPDKSFNFNIEEGNISIDGNILVVVGTTRYLPIVPQTIEFVDTNGGYYLLILNVDTLEFYIRQSTDIIAQTSKDVVCAAFMFNKGSGIISVNGIGSYYVNGQPKAPKITVWEPVAYEEGSIVFHQETGVQYYANQNTLPASIPGSSNRWTMYLQTALKRGEFVGKGSNVNVTNNNTLMIGGVGAIVVGNKRYVYNSPQEIPFGNGTFMLIFNIVTLDFSIRSTVDVGESTYDEVLVAGLFKNSSGEISINGISDYLINGEPRYSYVHNWTEYYYPKGAEVRHLGKTWFATEDTLPASIPGSSSRWAEKDSFKQQFTGFYTGQASTINFDVNNTKIVISGIAAVVINNNRYIVTQGDYPFPGETGGFYAILFDRNTGLIQIAIISQMTGLDPDLILIGTFHHHGTQGVITVTGINEYYVNGRPISNEEDSVRVILDGELPYYNSTISESMSVNDPVVLNDMPVEDFYQMYDDLMGQYPDYITKAQFGNQEGEGGSMMPLYYYRFRPANLIKNTPVDKKTVKVLIEPALHGGEKASAMTTFLLMKEVCENWKNDEFLETLRWNFEFVVIAVGSPLQWERSRLGTGSGRTNINGVDPNRNFSVGWSGGSSDPESTTYRGTSAFSEIEIQAIRDLAIEEYEPNAIAFGYHNFFTSAEEPYDIAWVIAPNPLNGAAQAFARKAARVYKQKESSIELGDDVPIVRINDNQNGGMSYKYYQSIGYKSFLMEINSNFQLIPLHEQNDNYALKYGVESLANMFRMAVKSLVNTG